MGCAATTGFGLGLCILQSHNFPSSFFKFHAKFGEDSSRETVAFANQSQQEMLGSNIVVVEVSSLIVSQIDDSLRPRRQCHILTRSGIPPRELLFDLRANSIQA